MEKPVGLIRQITSEWAQSWQEQMTNPEASDEAAGWRLTETRTAVTARNRDVRR
jgi:hypothetical protein